jgi:hypothetical protein
MTSACGASSKYFTACPQQEQKPNKNKQLKNKENLKLHPAARQLFSDYVFSPHLTHPVERRAFTKNGVLDAKI